jgi:hypothetical protein
VDESDGADSHEHDEHTFEKLQAGNGSQHAPLGDMRICFLSFLAHECGYEQSAGYHTHQERPSGIG